MELRTFTTFEADFPDDAEFAKSGDIKRPGGHNIALVLCEMLKRRGLKVANPQQHSFYGWAFFVSDDRLRFWFLLQSGERWLLLSQNKTSLLPRLFSSDSLSQHRRILETLNDIIAQDRRFQRVQWFTRRAFEKSKGKVMGDKSP